MSTQENKIPLIKSSKKKKTGTLSRQKPFSVLKVKQNIKRMVRTNDRFTGNVPSISDAALVTLSNMALELGHKIVTTATEAANKLNKKTVGSGEIMAGVSLELKGELMSHCMRFVKEELAKSSLQR